MKFPFTVKHNGINYEPGKEVPIGKEPVKENEYDDMTASQIRKELKEKYGVTKFPSNKKADLIEQLKQAEEDAKNKAREDKKNEEDEETPEDIESMDNELNNGEEEDENPEDEPTEDVVTPDGKSSFISKIMGK